jgi:hypothetical protein
MGTEDRPINDVVYAADRRINPPATRWKGFALGRDEISGRSGAVVFWDEPFVTSLATDGLHLVAGSFMARSGTEDRPINHVVNAPDRRI